MLYEETSNVSLVPMLMATDEPAVGHSWPTRLRIRLADRVSSQSFCQVSPPDGYWVMPEASIDPLAACICPKALDARPGQLTDQP
jgi:hypothetical protein